MKKVLYVISDSQFGGGSQHVLDLLENINRKKYTPILISRNSDIARKLCKNTKCYIVPLQSRIDMGSVRKIKKIIIKEKPDILHLHSTRAGILGTLAGKDYGLKIIYTEHLFTKDYLPENRFIHLMQKTAFKKLARYIAKVIAVSNAVKDYLVHENVFPADKIMVIYNGAKFLANKNIYNRKKMIIGTVGSLAHIKGYDYLIKSLGELKSPYLLKIIGTGEEKDNLSNLAHCLKLHKNIEFLGNVANLDREIAFFDIYVQPSISESFGLGIAQAMSAGIPVIASNVGGIPEIVAKCGILIEPKDIVGLTSALKKLIKNSKLRKKLGDCGQERIRKNFSIAKMINLTEKLYEKIT